MFRRSLILVAVTAMLALPGFEVNEATAGDETGNGAYCHWFKQKAMQTGDEYWWDRWRRCLRGDYWD